MASWKERNDERLAEIYPLLASRVRALTYDMAERGIPILVTQGLRTAEEQGVLYAQGRTAPGRIVTKAPAGYSSHNFGLAVDVVPDDVQKLDNQPDWNVSHPAWKTMLDVALGYKLNEGALWRTFPDAPHLYLAELQDKPTDAMRLLLSEGGLPAVWDWVSSIINEV